MFQKSIQYPFYEFYGFFSTSPLRLTNWISNQIWYKKKPIIKRRNKINLNLIFRFFWCTETTNMKKKKKKTITLMVEKRLIPTLLPSVKYNFSLLVIRLRLLKTPIAARCWLRLTGLFKWMKMSPLNNHNWGRTIVRRYS